MRDPAAILALAALLLAAWAGYRAWRLGRAHVELESRLSALDGRVAAVQTEVERRGEEE